MSVANPYIHESPVAGVEGAALRRRVTVASLTVACLLIVIKFVAYALTDSVSILTSLMDSAFDAIASGITLVSVMHAATPADEEHRFGHGKIEALTAMGQAVFILTSAGYLLFESTHRFLHPQPVRDAALGMGVIALSTVLTMLLVAFQRYVIRRSPSVAISADHLHYQGDVFMNLGVFSALGLSYFSAWPYYDPLFAAVVSCVLLVSAWKIGRHAYAILMDRELSDEDRARIGALVMAHPQARAMHDLRTRDSGQRVFIEFHLEMDGDLTLKQAHDVTEELELALYKEFPHAEVLIHQEPAGLEDHRLDHSIKS